MIRRVVAIGGPAGSGKSTAGRQVAATLGLEYRSAGEAFRAEAAHRGVDLEAFGAYAEAHPEVDRELDEAMQRHARPGVLLDGRVQGILCRRHGVPVDYVVVTASEAERVRRVAGRDGESIAVTARRLETRARSERARYLAIYGFDPDRETADLTIDSTASPPEDVARAIVRFVLRDAPRTGP